MITISCSALLHEDGKKSKESRVFNHIMLPNKGFLLNMQLLLGGGGWKEVMQCNKWNVYFKNYIEVV
jgi:hypothetical protein